LSPENNLASQDNDSSSSNDFDAFDHHQYIRSGASIEEQKESNNQLMRLDINRNDFRSLRGSETEEELRGDDYDSETE
jgi:hypothetical protein